MTTSQDPTLLSKARAYIGKSAVIAIAPLAMAQVANAATTFGVPGASSGGNGFGFISGGSESFSETNFFASALPESNTIVGTIIGMSGIFSTGGFGDGQFSMYLGGGNITGDPLLSGVNIPVTYNFTLSTNGASSLVSWSLDFGLGDAVPGNVSGNGYGVQSGSVNLVTGSSSSSYYPVLTINVSGFSGGEQLTVDMTGSGQGIALNAVPEPSTSALFVGASMFALLAVRRRPLRSVA